MARTPKHLRKARAQNEDPTNEALSDYRAGHAIDSAALDAKIAEASAQPRHVDFDLIRKVALEPMEFESVKLTVGAEDWAAEKLKAFETGQQLDASNPQYCPNCGASWQGEPIPEASQKAYGGLTHFRRCIAVYGKAADRTTGWACPDCRRVFDRASMQPTGKSLPMTECERERPEIPPEKMGGASIRVFLKVSKELSLTPEEQVGILRVPEASFRSWRELALAEQPLILADSILERISHLLGIYKELATIFRGSHGEWLRRPNTNPLFGGKPALDLMLNDPEGLAKVHEHLGPFFFGGWG